MNLFNILFNLFITLASYLLFNHQTLPFIHLLFYPPYQILHLYQLPYQLQCLLVTISYKLIRVLLLSTLNQRHLRSAELLHVRCLFGRLEHVLRVNHPLQFTHIALF
jgi:hypothetical protein